MSTTTKLGDDFLRIPKLDVSGSNWVIFKDRFLWHTLVDVEKPEAALSCEESAWVDLADLSPPLGGPDSERKPARSEKRRKLQRSA